MGGYLCGQKTENVSCFFFLPHIQLNWNSAWNMKHMTSGFILQLIYSQLLLLILKGISPKKYTWGLNVLKRRAGLDLHRQTTLTAHLYYEMECSTVMPKQAEIQDTSSWRGREHSTKLLKQQILTPALWALCCRKQSPHQATQQFLSRINKSQFCTHKWKKMWLKSNKRLQLQCLLPQYCTPMYINHSVAGVWCF